MSRSTFSKRPLLAAEAVICLFAFTMGLASAQTTTPIVITNATGMQPSYVRPVSISGSGTISPLGTAAASFTGSQDQNIGTIQGAFTFSFSRLDSFNVKVTPQPVTKMTSLNLSGSISGGTGAYSGATGSVTLTFKYTGTTSSAGFFTLTGSGKITVGTTTTSITLAGFNGPASVANAATGTFLSTPSGNVAPFGAAAVSFSGMSKQGGPASPTQGAFTFVFNANDSFIASFSLASNFINTPLNLPCTITGGTGIFSGATGSLAATFAANPDGSYTLSGTGSITQPPAGAPMITSVTTANAGAAIAQNTFIVIKGTNLVPASTAAAGVIWSTAPSFASGLLPTQLGPVSVTVNSKPAFVYFYCSAVTDPACSQDQLNILTPLDSTTGPVPVMVQSGTVSIAPFSINLQPVSPSLLLFDTVGHIAATHANYSLLGPIGLYPTSTPAAPGETITLYAVGFGLPATALINGSSTQAGSLAVIPVCQVGGTSATLTFAGLSGPGLYQLNLTIPPTAANGDNTLVCSYNGYATPAGNLITVQQ
jgi:uncharacterized protein (TIGR03437 family)